MFDPEAYDPFEHHGPRTEAHQRINQINSQVGWPAVLDWAEHDKNVEAMVNATFARLSDLDRNADAQHLAYKTVQLHRSSADVTVPGLCAIFAHDPTIALPLSAMDDWEPIATQHLRKYVTCDVSICSMCEPRQANQNVAIKLGEFICIYKCCNGCRAFFDMTPDERERFDQSRYFDEIDRR